MDNITLIKMAIDARKQAYCPYSNHKVGAALLTKSGKVYLGCNIENAAFGPTICAERVAIFKAVSEGESDFAKIAIVGGLSDDELDVCAPCGVCRQVMREFCDPQTFEIILAKVKHEDIQMEEHTLEELLPLSFGPNNLDK